MNNQEKYISAMKHLKFDDKLKNRTLENLKIKYSKKHISFLPKTVISLACIQIILYCFTITSVGCINL